MMYLIALILPPLAILLVGKPVQAILNGALWVAAVATIAVGLGIGLGLVSLIHALFVVHGHYADRRTARLMRAMAPEESYRQDFRGRARVVLALLIGLGLLAYLAGTR